jgi:hypothetical protein
MGLNSAKLAKKMNSLIVANIKKQFKDASPGGNMKRMPKAISEGFVLNVAGKRGKTSGAGAGSVGLGITGIQAKDMSEIMISNCKKAFGSEGPALKAITMGIAEAIVEELKTASVVSDKGGIASKFKLGSATKMGKDMMKATGFKKSPYNEKLFIVLSKGIIDAIEKNGKSIIPRSGPGGGPGIAVIS